MPNSLSVTKILMEERDQKMDFWRYLGNEKNYRWCQDAGTFEGFSDFCVGAKDKVKKPEEPTTKSQGLSFWKQYYRWSLVEGWLVGGRWTSVRRLLCSSVGPQLLTRRATDTAAPDFAKKSQSGGQWRASGKSTKLATTRLIFKKKVHLKGGWLPRPNTSST